MTLIGVHFPRFTTRELVGYYLWIILSSGFSNLAEFLWRRSLRRTSGKPGNNNAYPPSAGFGRPHEKRQTMTLENTQNHLSQRDGVWSYQEARFYIKSSGDLSKNLGNWEFSGRHLRKFRKFYVRKWAQCKL